MAVCQYFLRGACKFGDQCRNEHPQNGDRRTAFGGSTWTPASGPRTIPYSLETMIKDFDFKADKPSWPLSSYGPAKHEKNLLPPLDESPEELRFKAVTAMRNGTTSEYLQYEQNAFANAEQVFMNVRNDIKGAFEAAKRHSLGTDTQSGSSTAFSVGQPSVFGAQGSGSTSAFGQQQGTSAFGTPAFGAPAFGQTPSFGQSSVPKSAFGGAATNSGGFSAFAGPGPSAFATAATNPTTSAGPGPSAFTTAATNPTTSAGSVFGQPAFGSSGGGPQPGQSVFGAANSTSPNSAFARPGPLGSTSGSGFGQTSPFNTANNASSAFGQPPPAGATPFAQTPTATSTSPTAPFGQPAPSTSAFGQSTSVFGQPTATSAFGQPSSVFGTAPTQQSAFGQAVSPVSQGGPTGAPKPHATSTAPDFANAKSTYRPGSDPYDSLLPENYSSLLPDTVRAAFAASRFSWDNVPEWIPPLDMR